MNKTIATTARALTIGLVAILGFNAAKASPDDVSQDRSTKESLKYVVRFADLNISNIEGAKALYGRLHYAAKVVCKPLEGAGAWGSAQYETCMKKAVADAVADVNRPLLSQYHQSRTKSDNGRVVQLAKAN
jgi:UrcA family protein